MKPTLHLPIPLETRVRVIRNFFGPSTVTGKREDKFVGTVVGIATIHVIFTYIVLLDTPSEDPDFGLCRAIVVQGTGLESEDGTRNWRLPHA